MKYSYRWLQKHIDEPLPAPESLKETIIFHAFEVEALEEKGGDTIFDIKVLPDRAGDCLSHYGMAREIAGLLNLTLKEMKNEPLPAKALALPVEIKSDLCRRYIAIEMDGVKVGPSPEWLKTALESVGQRSINNIVDATNYILLDTGQPTHAFDTAKIDGGITVRSAHEGETIITLSEESRTLTPDMLVIADYVGALAIAGVKGGKTAEISSSSPDAVSSIVLEVANFNPTNIRKTAHALGLQTDASKRFENNLSPEVATAAAMQLVALIKAVAGGDVVGVHDHSVAPETPRMLVFSDADVARLLGATIDAYTIEDVLDQYHYDFTKEESKFTLTIPYWRSDIVGVHDVAEEIGRVVGYDRIGPKPLPFAFEVAHSLTWQSIQSAKLWLIEHGYREVLTYTFVKKGDVEIVRGPKNKSALRTNLSDGLKESFDMNNLHAPLLGDTQGKLFEIGTVFFTDRSAASQDVGVTKEEIHVAIIESGLIQETTLEAFIAEHAIAVHTVLYDQTPVGQPFVSWSVYPFITRDIAVWVRNDEDLTRLERIVADFAKEYCIRPAALFDQFTKEGRTSAAFRLVFQAYDRTLTESEVETWFTILTERILAEKVFDIR